MYYKIFIAVSIILTTALFFSCGENKTTGDRNLPVTMDDSSRVIIDRAIAYAGGYGAWQQKKTLSFDKKSTSYDSTGKIIRQIDQHFDYMLKPVYKAKVSYMLNDTAILLVHDGEIARKFYNGKMSEEQKDIDGAWNAGFGSQFVMCMPYKLKDPGITATYAGQVTLINGEPAQVVKTSYMKGAGSNYDHIWYYYFEPGTGKLLANSLNGKDNFWDYTRYESFEKANGLLLPGVRKSYTAEGLNKPGKLVTESRHFNIAFDKELKADYFTMPDDK